MNLIWYNSLNKPTLNPPAETFAPVWGVLYFLMLLAFWLMLYSDTNKDKKPAIIFFVIQLLLNLSWSPVFFYFHNIKFAFVIITLLTIFLLLTIVAFFKISKNSGIIMSITLYRQVKSMKKFFLKQVETTGKHVGMIAIITSLKSLKQYQNQ